MNSVATPDTTRILLWSKVGSGQHYNGPGSFAYRMYSLAPKGAVSVSLAHAFAEQEPVELFQRQDYIGESNGLLNMFRFLSKSKRYLQEHAKSYDVFHTLNGFHASAVPASYAEKLGLPAVMFVTNHRLEFADKPGIRGILRLPAKRREIIRNLSGMIAMSTDIYSELREYDVQRRNIARIPMGVNVDRFSPVDDQRKRELRNKLGMADRPTVVFVGTLVQRKHPLLIAQAVERLVRSGTECQAYIVGPHTTQAEYSQQIKDYIEEQKLDEYVKLIPFTDEIEQYHQAADLFCLPSDQEGMPAAMVEAMACGTPSLGTAISGINDLIDDGVDGRIVERTPESIADAMKSYIDAPQTIASHGELCRQKVLDRYSADAVLGAYLKLFKLVRSGGDPCDASILPEME